MNVCHSWWPECTGRWYQQIYYAEWMKTNLEPNECKIRITTPHEQLESILLITSNLLKPLFLPYKPKQQTNLFTRTNQRVVKIKLWTSSEKLARNFSGSAPLTQKQILINCEIKCKITQNIWALSQKSTWNLDLKCLMITS